MTSLVEQLAGHRMFVLARPDKHPCDIEGRDSNAQDASTWLSAEDASTYAQLLGLHVGIVLSEGCGLACIDIDSALQTDNTWSPLAVELCSRFPGAYIEVSLNGRGLHIFASYRGALPKHRTRWTPPGTTDGLHVELYSTARYILTTGTQATGDARSEHSAALHGLIAERFTADERTDTGAEWTSAPVAAWRGPVEDAELLQVAMRSNSLKATFGKGARFEDLWTANADALARAFPPQSPGQTWDGSAADLALANHLGFYTGNDCERMLRLMRASALVRAKWDRPDYLPRTILQACSKQAECYRAGQPTAAAPQVPQPPSTMPVGGVPHRLTINARNKYEATLENLVHVLAAQEQTRIGFDTFRGRIMVAHTGTEAWRPLTDTDMIQLREALGRVQGFAAIGKELMHDSLQLVAERHKFDSAIVWLDGLTWDGMHRVTRFLTDYCGTLDDDYSQAVSLYIWTGLAARVYEPGCQLDMVVALHSRQQGLYKSTALQGLVPDPELFTDGLELHNDNDNFKRMLRGKLVVEIAELAGLSRADVTLVKRVITRRVEEWVEKWQTQPTRFLRRCMLFATTNEEQFLPKDDSGQRRWLPVEVARIDRERIKADRDQLWAEGASMYRNLVAAGLPGVLYAEAERLAAGRHARHEQTDVWEPIIERWLNEPIPGPNGALQHPPCTRAFTINEVLAGALLMNKDRMDKKAEMRAAGVLRQLGYEKRAMRVDGKTRDRWMRVA